MPLTLEASCGLRTAALSGKCSSVIFSKAYQRYEISKLKQVIRQGIFTVHATNPVKELGFYKILIVTGYELSVSVKLGFLTLDQK